MSKRPLARALAAALIVSLVVPAAFLMAPPRTIAAITVVAKTPAPKNASCLGGLAGSIAGLIAASVVTSVPNNSKVETVTTAGAWGATLGQCINEFVIRPLIRAAIRALLQKITASIVDWINGGNGTGQPSYVRSLPRHLQNIGDNNALAFFGQFKLLSGSPFATAITSSLSRRYLQDTSADGFFGQNKDTFVTAAGSRANADAFLSGNWSKGGISAWFALTTQSNNNPYMLHQAAQSQLSARVGGAQSARKQELDWGNGFISWCGPATVDPTPVNPSAVGGDCSVNSDCASAAPYCNPSTYKCQGTPVADITGATAPGSASAHFGTAPGDACQNKDGTFGKIQTPGSVIHHYTEKAVVDLGLDQYVNADDIDSAFDAIMGALINQVLGGVNGLFGASHASDGGRPLISQLRDYSDPPAGTPPVDTSSPTAIVESEILQGAATRASSYEQSWGIISSAADYALSALTDLKNSCPAQAGEVDAAIANILTPIQSRVDAANAVLAEALAMLQQVQNEKSSGDPAYSADLQTLQSMPPSDVDVSSAQQATQSTGGAVANPPGSLNISGGTTIDQLALLAQNAAALEAACP